MEGAALELIRMIATSNDPFAKVLAICAILVFGFLLLGINRKLTVINSTVSTGFTAGAERMTKIEDVNVRQDADIRQLKVHVGLAKPDLADG